MSRNVEVREAAVLTVRREKRQHNRAIRHNFNDSDWISITALLNNDDVGVVESVLEDQLALSIVIGLNT